MADLGLLAGLAEGLKSGVESYRDQSRYNEEQAMKRRALRLQLAQAGLEETPDGDFSKTADLKKREAFERAEKQAGLLKSGYTAEYDPSANEAKLVPVPGFKDIEKEKARAEIGKLNAEAAKARGETGGKIVPAGEAVSTAGSTSASEALGDVEKLVSANEDLFGPGQGRVAGLMGSWGLNNDAQSADATLKQRAQIIGKYLEGGKLTDADIERYQKSLPQLSDSPQVAQSKIASLRRLIAQKQAAELDSLRGAGYDTRSIPRVAQIPPLPGLVRQKSGLIPQAAASEVKVVGNKTYRKVPGGWQEVE